MLKVTQFARFKRNEGDVNLIDSGDNKQLRGKQIGDDHDRKKENNSGGCGEADRYLP